MSIKWATGNVQRLRLPAVCLWHNANQSIPNITWTPLTFNTPLFDHEGQSSPPWIYIRTPGIYAIGAHFTWQFGGGTRVCAIVNAATGAPIAYREESTAVHIIRPLIAVVRDAVATDLFYVSVWQNSGGALNVESSVSYSPLFWACYLGPGGY